jgi:hypothetical protein
LGAFFAGDYAQHQASVTISLTDQRCTHFAANPAAPVSHRVRKCLEAHLSSSFYHPHDKEGWNIFIAIGFLYRIELLKGF